MATYIPESQRDHRYGIFIERYMIQIPYIYTRTKDDIREFGMPSSGFKEYDVGQENELVTRYVTINDMLEYYLNGVNVLVKKYEDTARIYLAISDYLNHWLKHIRNTFSTNHVPLEDLQNLDKFANVVYDKAKYQFTTTIVDDALMRAVNDVALVNYDTIIAKPTVVHVNHAGVQKALSEENEDTEVYPKRDNMMEMFKAVRARRTKRN